MGSVNSDIFRAYDIRGTWREDFDAVFARRLARRVASYLHGGTLLVGRDARESSDELAYAVIAGAVQAGSRVIDVGEVSSPQFFWAVRAQHAAGGIMVTASHNPDKQNGCKVVVQHADGIHIVGGHELHQIYDSAVALHGMHGTVAYQDIAGEYAEAVRRAAQWSGGELHCTLDAPATVRRVVSALASVIPDHRFGVRCDTDGDRIVFYEDGHALPADWVFLFLVEYLRCSSVVADLRFSRGVAEQLAAWGVRHTPSPVGRPALVQRMRESGAAVGAEISGHYYWEAFGSLESPEYTLLLIARALAIRGKSLAECVAPFRRYHKSPEYQISIHDRKDGLRTLEHVARFFEACTIHRLDGVTVDCWDTEGWWCNLRMSNTEPCLRLVVEATSGDLLTEKVMQLKEIIGR